MYYTMNIIYVKLFDSNDLILPDIGIFDPTFEVEQTFSVSVTDI